MIWLKRLLGLGAEKSAAPATKREYDRDAAILEIDELLRARIAGGFESEEDIAELTVEVLSDDFDPVMVKSLVPERLKEQLANHTAEAASWPAETDCDRLDRAFAQLEAAGIICRQNFTCCQSCGNAEIGDETSRAGKTENEIRGYTFYHQQDTESAVAGGGLYLAYGAFEKRSAATVGIGREVAQKLSENGLTVEWDGSAKTRILVKLDWKKRRGPRCESTRRPVRH